MKSKLPKEEIQHALETIKQFCLSREATIAVAESVSSGLLQNLVGSGKGAMMFFEGGITTYNCDQKLQHLQVPFEECNPYKGVTQRVAEKMALGVCQLFNCEIGLSLTGYASPLPDRDLVELFAYGAIVLNGEVIFSKKIHSEKENPEEVKAEYCHQLLLACENLLQHKSKSSVI
ncbi:nicotinamide-nucleotide amidohydrolase family protein [Marivirga sp. S37H4]|uniref:Nicotinamide-nucleotide amidohydrolase family protein n=1 Tax=Marivirga aurantiaca TaxID=2802615 RepID=A0A935C956_9BACT|nr:nicotinamide-nucleotide amidohydrolase family protein [Marivirga aurantiaca]MBK6264073.1 nicotinamide-nucleotide amidohydrolase family protein [Marivirga aurantiaca]